MNSEIYSSEILRQDIVNHNLSIKALIHDIYECSGPLELLNELNSDGRAKLATLRKEIYLFENLAREQESLATRGKMLEEAKSLRDQLTSTLDDFRKANITCMLAIEKSDKEKLFANSEENSLRQRKQNNKAHLVKMSTNVTDQLLSISRHLAETTQRSSDTLDTLVNSSSNVQGTQKELLVTGSVISQSGKLLAKYARREFTDKVILLFAFAFFLACVFYIVQKRLF